MTLFKEINSLQNYIFSKKELGNSIGFVPTMGALHQGHVSLIKQSKSENSITVCSIFVNPTQFNNADDFAKYPITIESDIDLLEKEGCNVIFLPTVSEMYGSSQITKTYELGYIETVLEGKYRPGHFNGVCTIVDKLLAVVQPTTMYLGQKDYQQCMVIKIMMQQHYPSIQLTICPTIRETDGLAMSSRNRRLNTIQRQKALKIIETLNYIKMNVVVGNLLQLKKDATNFLQNNGYKVDYTEIADATTLQIVDDWDGEKPLVALVAAYLDTVRLIDNVKL